MIKSKTMNIQITEEQAFKKLSALCARAEHCQYEMTEKMRRWQVPEDVQARVMERLVKNKYVDDDRYSRAFVRDKVRYNKWGRLKVAQALRMKRIPDDVIAAALDEIDRDEYLGILRQLIQAKRKSTKADSEYSLKMKLMRFAASRGFTAEEASEEIYL